MFITLREVTKTYNRGLVNEVEAIRGVDLEIARGEMVCLSGPSGSGKTTLLSLIGCVFSPTSGLVAVDGRKLSRLPDHFMTRYRRQYVGFVFQHFHLFPALSVLDNVTLPLYPLGVSPRERRRRGSVLLDRLGVAHRISFPVAQLSGGEMQRVALARALINDPPLLVADEPTAHLDSRLALEILALFAELKAEGRTLVVTSHDSLVTGYGAVDRVCQVVDGKLT